MSNIWLISDLHLGHGGDDGRSGILRFEPDRVDVLGATIIEHDDALIKRINMRVKPEDRLIIVGDVGLGAAAYLKHCLDRVVCKNVTLVVGNHDKLSHGMYYWAGISMVCQSMELRVAKQTVLIRHHPYRKSLLKSIFPWQHKERDRNKRPIDRGQWLIHGHVHHGTPPQKIKWINGRMINVGVDFNDYRPVALKDIEKVIQRGIMQEEKKGWFKKLYRFLSSYPAFDR